MRLEPHGSFYLDAMSHKHNTTVPGVVGYHPQSSKGGRDERVLTDPYNQSHYGGTGGVNTGPGSFNPVEIPGDHH